MLIYIYNVVVFILRGSYSGIVLESKFQLSIWSFKDLVICFFVILFALFLLFFKHQMTNDKHR
jgi:hypothetical protein